MAQAFFPARTEVTSRPAGWLDRGAGSASAGVTERTGRRFDRGVNPLTFELGDAPVHDEHFAEVADHDVGGLQVAMDDATGVRVLNALADLQKYIEQAT